MLSHFYQFTFVHKAFLDISFVIAYMEEGIYRPGGHNHLEASL